MPEAGRLCELVIPVVSGVKEQSGARPVLPHALSEPGHPSASRLWPRTSQWGTLTLKGVMLPPLF